ncbi:hypothetical protein HYS47_05510 [Candidatus Woesearchaeota archaeon]|nr:hypothetical protein [Candidatus Woesearchaeota archaeon]
MKQESTQAPFSDTVLSYNNGVSAVYIVGQDVLQAENRPNLFKVPFLVWNGSWTPIGESVERARALVGVPYLSRDQFGEMEKQLYTRGKVPESVVVNGVAIPSKSLASMYVPYSFGIGHQQDVETRARVRSLDDFADFTARVLPRVAEIRAEREQRKQDDNRLVNRVLTAVGLHTPASFTEYQPAGQPKDSTPARYL